jgi:hypothetical protein
MFSVGNRLGVRSQNPSINTENDSEQIINIPQGTLKVEDGIKNLFFSGLRPFPGLLNYQNYFGNNNQSSNSYFTIQPIYFYLFQIFEHLGKYFILFLFLKLI